MLLRYLGHSAVQLRSDDLEILIDPFISDNPRAPIGVADVAPHYIVITHAHGDHWGDTEVLAKEHGATIVASAEIATYAAERGLKAHGMNVGGAWDFGPFRVKFTPAWHSNSFPDGTYAGMPMGAVLDVAGKRLYHAGDTALFTDMKLIGRGGLDLAMLPIGDNFTMGPQEALEAIELLQPKQVMPIHYDTFDVIKQDGAAFAAQVESRTASSCLLLEPGQTAQL